MIAKITSPTTIEVYDLSQFDAHAIMHSGQVFRYFAVEDGYKLVVGTNYATVRVGEVVRIECNNASYFWRYFDLDTDYNAIKAELSKYTHFSSAIEAGGGIRILKSDFFEMVISFIISANNNIKRFTKTLNGIAERFGSKLNCGLYSFPTVTQLGMATEEDFKMIGAGYRSGYLVRAVKQLSNIDISEIASLPSNQQHQELCKIVGVGNKVCSCVRLFCGDIHDLSVCPLDTWLKKALLQVPESQHEALLNHAYAGVLQQYVFYYYQHLKSQM